MVFELVFESDRAKCLKEFNKTEDELTDYKTIIYKWLDQQRHLPQINDQKLEVMLITAKFSLEKTKKQIEKYYTIRRIEPDFFANWDVLSPSVAQGFRAFATIPIPKVNPKDYCQVYVVRILDSNPEIADIVQFFKSNFMIAEMLLPQNYVLGHHIVFDMTGFKLGHMIQSTPTVMHKYMTISSDVYTFRFAGMHLINGSSYLDPLLKVCKLAMKAKLYDRLKVHKNLDSLHKIISKDCLPAEYGGTLPPFIEIHDALMKKVENSRQMFIDEMKVQTDESKRIEKLDLDQLYGSIHGSFRKLQVD